jgi:hypothetical protein
VHDGHRGPKEIGVEPEFLSWLTDPVRNGGGALTDFGCYGANLMTFLMEGEVPLAVTAVTRQVKPAIYPRVDDEATIVLTYPRAQAILQASWNWPVNRKDMEVYGERGYALAPDRGTVRLRRAESAPSRAGWNVTSIPRAAVRGCTFSWWRRRLGSEPRSDGADDVSRRQTPRPRSPHGADGGPCVRPPPPASPVEAGAGRPRQPVAAGAVRPSLPLRPQLASSRPPLPGLCCDLPLPRAVPRLIAPTPRNSRCAGSGSSG